MSQVFNGSSDKVYNTSIPVATYPVTLACWVKPTNLNSTEQTILGAGYWDGSTGGNGFFLGIDSSNKWAFRLPTVSLQSAATGPTSGAWYPVCLTIDSSKSCTLYVNGSSVKTYTASSIPTATGCVSRGAMATNATPSAWARYFKGELQEVAIWNVALSGSEVSTLAGSVVGLDGAYGVHYSGLRYYLNLALGGDPYEITWLPSDTVIGTTFQPHNVQLGIPYPIGWTVGGALPCSTTPVDWELSYTPSWTNYPLWSGPGLPGVTDPIPLWVQAFDWHGGPCTVANQKMPWIKGRCKWICGITVGTCRYVLSLTYQPNLGNFILTIRDPTTDAVIETIAASMTCNVSPLAVFFMPIGTEFASCGCNSFGGFNITKNSV